jgi:hypothetical protein
MGNRSMFVGMGVHKETIDISVAEGGRQGEVRHYGVIAPDLEALDKVVRALHTFRRPPSVGGEHRILVRTRLSAACA